MYYNSKFLLFIINSNGRKIFIPPYQKKMKLLSIYLLSLFVFASVGTHLGNNIKQSLQERTSKIDSVLSSYSMYLQNN